MITKFKIFEDIFDKYNRLPNDYNFNKFYVATFDNTNCSIYFSDGKGGKRKTNLKDLKKCGLGGNNAVYLLSVINFINEPKKNDSNPNIITAFRAIEYIYDKKSPNGMGSMALNVYYNTKENKYYREGGHDEDLNTVANPHYEYRILWKGDNESDAYKKFKEFNEIYKNSNKYNI